MITETARGERELRSALHQGARSGLFFLLFLLAAHSLVTVALSQTVPTTATTPPAAVNSKPPAPQKFAQEGIAVEFTINPLAAENGKTAEPMEGADAQVGFRITDARTGQPVTNLHPAAWINFRESGMTTDARRCREKIQSFLQSNYNARPDVDLNTYFILALNHEPNISVIDPLSGFGSSKLYTLVSLKSPGEDWALTGDQKRLFVSMPLVNQVAVVDTTTWKTLANIDAGTNPERLTLQHDEKYLWVGNDGDATTSGVTLIDTESLKVIARFRTGAGHHEIALGGDDRYAFVTSKADGTLDVIDVARLTKLKSLKMGSLPTALAFSPLSKAVYVINEGDGAIVVIDAERLEILTRLDAKPGLSAIRFPPDVRYGFVVNREANTVSILDAATNRLLHTLAIGQTPDQISFTRNFAYVRSLGNEFVMMISLAQVGKEGLESAIARFPGGQKAPRISEHDSFADAIVAAPEDGAVLVANPADQMIYYYMEGMAAPMGSFQNYRRAPTAVLVLNKSLRETSPGLYTTTIRLTRPGNFDVAFLLDSPRLVNCFDLTVKANPELQRDRPATIRIEALDTAPVINVGENHQLRFKVTDAKTNQPKSGLKDIGVLTFLAPGIWQQREWAKPIGDGLYELNFTPPQTGVYYIFFQCPSLGLQYNQTPHLILEAVKRSRPANSPASPAKP